MVIWLLWSWRSFMLPSLKLTCPLKRYYFNRKYIFQPLIFRGELLVSGRIISVDLPRQGTAAASTIFSWMDLFAVAATSQKQVPNGIPFTKTRPKAFWLVVSTHLKNISQIGSFPQVGMNTKNVWNHQLVFNFDIIKFYHRHIMPNLQYIFIKLNTVHNESPLVLCPTIIPWLLHWVPLRFKKRFLKGIFFDELGQQWLAKDVTIPWCQWCISPFSNDPNQPKNPAKTTSPSMTQPRHTIYISIYLYQSISPRCGASSFQSSNCWIAGCNCSCSMIRFIPRIFGDRTGHMILFWEIIVNSEKPVKS